ncbi:MAG TPA: hypothetical protein VGD67_14475 [Pseudonocardiaceae bacterium]
MERSLGRVDQVEGLWPVDGPHDGVSVVEAAGAVAVLARYLAHATHAVHRAPESAPQVYRCLTALSGGLWSLSQSVRQVAGRMEVLADASELYADRLGSPADPVDLALGTADLTGHAGGLLAQAADVLGHAASSASRLGHRDLSAGEEGDGSDG